MEQPIIVEAHPGIGDFSWTYSVLAPMGRPMIVWYHSHDAGQIGTRLEPFLDLLPLVVGYERKALNVQQLDHTPGPERQQVCEGRHIICAPNHHLEQGRPLADYAPELPSPDYHYPINTTAGHVAEARMLVPFDDYLLCYTSSRNTAMRWNGWDAATWDHFFQLVWATSPTTKIVVMGAPYDVNLARDMRAPIHNIVGQTAIGVAIEVIRRARHFVSFPSGLAVLATLVRTPVTMFYPKDLRPGVPAAPLMRSWVDPALLDTPAYTPLYFTSPERVAASVLPSLLGSHAA